MMHLFPSDFQRNVTRPARRPLAIFGAGGWGREVVMLVHQINEHHPVWELVGVYDDVRPHPEVFPELPYRGTADDLNAATAPLHVAVAVGNSHHRAAVVARLRSPHLSFATLVHPSVARAPYQRLRLGAGCIVAQGCILTTDVTLGAHVLLNLGCTVGHDAVLEDFCSLMPHANVGGNAHLETGVYLGTNATVINHVRVGARTIVGAGAVAVRDLPADCTAVGVPAKVVKEGLGSLGA